MIGTINIQVMITYYAIKYFKLNALIIEAIKSHQVFIDDMDEQIKWLKTYIN